MEKIDPDGETSLEEIGFKGVMASATWEETLFSLKQFKKREGHCDVPQSHKEERELTLGWVSRQRDLKKKGKLDLGRETRLEEVGPGRYKV